MKKILIGFSVMVAIATGVAFANGVNPRQVYDFYVGHTHNGEETVGAPSHSGGTDRYGCHNASVPYHCH